MNGVREGDGIVQRVRLRASDCREGDVGQREYFHETRLAPMRALRKAFNQMLTSCLLVAIATPAIAQSPEMARLAKALAGDWSSVEVVQFGKPVPEGAGRRGATHVRLAGGGTVLVDEGHTVGAVGGD
jgi:hypothetical protein